MDIIKAIAQCFDLPGKVCGVCELDGGNVNKTFLLSLTESSEKIILQRINGKVFQNPEQLVSNVAYVLEHMQRRFSLESADILSSWKNLKLYAAVVGRNKYVIDAEGGYWRALNFIEKAQAFETIQNVNHAKEIGKALGIFHTLVNDLNPEKLYDILPGFHLTSQYLKQYDKVNPTIKSQNRIDEVNFCEQFIASRRTQVDILEDARKNGMLDERIIHGDPKCSNFMIDVHSCHAVAIIDLDTVMPGLLHYDVGDCLRSCCNKSGEETSEYDTVEFDITLFVAILEGYIKEVDELLNDNDYDYFYDAVHLLSFELGLRFFTDYLADNVYFKVDRQDQNLDRALVQFKLTESIEDQEIQIRQLLSSLR